MGAQIKEVCEAEKPQKLDLLPQSTISYLKYRFWLPKFLSMASSEPMPRYFFSLIPSEKKYSPGASVVAARRDPIITGTRGQEQHISSRKAVAAKTLRVPGHSTVLDPPPCPLQVYTLMPRIKCRTETFPRRLPTTCTTQPDDAPLTCGGPEREGLCNVPNRLDPSICDHGDTESPGVFGHLVHRCGLGAAARQHCRRGESRERVSPHAAARSLPSRPFRLPAHTCSSTQERTNPWMLLP